jgi:glycerate 2-kinase
VKVVAAPDGFRGSLSAADAAAAMARGARSVLADAEIIELPVADGGEGTVGSAAAAGFAVHTVPARGPLGDEIEGPIAVHGDRAVVELAELCGWPRMPAGRTAPLTSNTLGLGDGIRAALDLGCREIVVGLGGSVSIDGGTGMLVALGAALRDADGKPIEPGGAALEALREIDISGLDPRLAQARVLLATDVANPLLGPRGAATVFGPQKGASPDEVALLERGLTQLAAVVEQATGVLVRDRAGCGAAGGVGATAVPYLRAEVGSGADLVLDLLGFDKLAAGADLVITGEGRWDAQSGAGKAPARVAARAWAVGADVALVAGSVEAFATELAALGITQCCALTDLEPDKDRAIRDAAELVERASALVVQRWQAR